MDLPVATNSISPSLAKNALRGVWDQLRNVTDCEVLVGAEIEFYLDRTCRRHHAQVLNKYAASLVRDGISLQSVKREIGDCQYEVALHPSLDPLFLAQSIQHLRVLARDLGNIQGCSFSFSAREERLSPPSALQINISLLDYSGVNKYSKAIGIEAETEVMQHSIAGLCRFMNASMKFFAPTEESFKRFTYPFLDGPYRFANAPTAVSWGGDNRTVAIRIPVSSTDPNSRHLEHRVPCADAEPSSTIACILASIAFGIAERLPLGLAKVWGDASADSTLVRLVKSLPEAVASYQDCEELRSRLELQF